MTTMLLTGASGVLGSHLRAHMEGAGCRVMETDIRPAADRHDVVEVDLFSAESVDRLVDGVDEIVRFGAISSEKSRDLIQSVNIGGTRTISESARKHGVRRVICASSCHVMGFYPRADSPIRLGASVRPDTMYAVSKIFGESCHRYCYGRYGLECLVVRICTAFPPKSRRGTRNFCDRDDLARGVDGRLDMPNLGFRTVYALSEPPIHSSSTSLIPASAGSHGCRPGPMPPSLRKRRSISTSRPIVRSVVFSPFQDSSS